MENIFFTLEIKSISIYLEIDIFRCHVQCEIIRFFALLTILIPFVICISNKQIVISEIAPTVPFAWLLLATTASLGISDEMRENYRGSEMLMSEM